MAAAVPRTSLSTTLSRTFPNYRIEGPTPCSEEQARYLCGVLPNLHTSQCKNVMGSLYLSVTAHPSQPKHCSLTIKSKERWDVRCQLDLKRSGTVSTLALPEGPGKVPMIRSVVGLILFLMAKVRPHHQSDSRGYFSGYNVAMPLSALATRRSAPGPASYPTPNLF